MIEAAVIALAGACCAAAAVRARRRRGRLNGALHELRRPLQRLALAVDALPPGTSCEQLDRWLEQASGALARLDAEVNGDSRGRRAELIPLGELLGAAAARWHGDEVEIAIHSPRAAIAGDRLALGQAIDNLVANALEHGEPPVRIEAAVRAGELWIEVLDSGGGQGAGRRRAAVPGDPRRGHGIPTVRGIARAQGGSAFGPRAAAGGSDSTRTVAGLRVPGSTTS